MPHLVLARHGESELNAAGCLSGNADTPLTVHGRTGTRHLARKIADLKPDLAFCSALSRAVDTLNIILHENSWNQVQVTIAPELNERDYGPLTGRNKAELSQELGAEEFKRLRLGWNEPIPQGETLKMVYDRVMPFFEHHIRPALGTGHETLIVAHEHVLRALRKHFDELSNDAIARIEFPHDEVIVYEFTQAGHLAAKYIRKLV